MRVRLPLRRESGIHARGLSVLLALVPLLAGCDGSRPARHSQPPSGPPTSRSSVEQYPPNPSPARIESPEAKTPTTSDQQEITVYITRTGAKYHRAGCRYLSKSCIPTTLKQAKGRYGPCSVCGPPR